MNNNNQKNGRGFIDPMPLPSAFVISLSSYKVEIKYHDEQFSRYMNNLLVLCSNYAKNSNSRCTP